MRLPHPLKPGVPAPLLPVSPVMRKREKEADDGSVQDRTGHPERLGALGLPGVCQQSTNESPQLGLEGH